MALGDVIGVMNGGGLNLTGLPPELISRVGSLITILKAAGIVFIVYIAFLFLRWFFSFKRYKKLKHMDKKIEEIDKKLDVLLRGKKAKPHNESSEKPEEHKKKEKNKKKK